MEYNQTYRKSKPPWRCQPHTIKELQAFLGMTDYLSKFSPSMTSLCEPLQKLTSSRAVWTWNASCQALYDKTNLNKGWHVHEVLQWNQIPLPSDRCIWDRTWHCPVTPQRWYNMPKRYHPKQHHSQCPSHLQAKAWPVQSEGTVTLREKHEVYCMVSKIFTIIVLLGL